MDIPAISAARRWWMLGLGLLATLCSQVFITGIAFLIPTLHTRSGLDLGQAGLISGLPAFGLVLTLIIWGYAVDLVGERRVLTASSALTAMAAFAAATSHSLVTMSVFLVFGGMAAGGSNSASGRLVVGWFEPGQRGLAMGIRQTAQPLGVGLGALVIPRLAEGHGVGPALFFPAVLCGLASILCAAGVIDPPRPRREHASADELANPYRGLATLWRIHAVSVLLVVPQSVVWTFALVWLMAERGWAAGTAGLIVMFAQILGAVGRIAAGRWSDQVGSRLGPIRIIAAAAGTLMIGLAITDLIHSSWSVAVMVMASAVTVSDNGLAYTAIAEIAGPFWSGRALGTQNTSQWLAASISPPTFGALIGIAGYPGAFALCALIACLAIPVVPIKSAGLISRDMA